MNKITPPSSKRSIFIANKIDYKKTILFLCLLFSNLYAFPNNNGGYYSNNSSNSKKSEFYGHNTNNTKTTLSEKEIQFAILKYIPLHKEEYIKAEYKKYIEDIDNNLYSLDTENKEKEFERKKSEDRVRIWSESTKNICVSWDFSCIEGASDSYRSYRESHINYFYEEPRTTQTGKSHYGDYYNNPNKGNKKNIDYRAYLNSSNYYTWYITLSNKEKIAAFNKQLYNLLLKVEQWKKEVEKNGLTNFEKIIPGFEIDVMEGYSKEKKLRAKFVVDDKYPLNESCKTGYVVLFLDNYDFKHFLELDIRALETLIALTDHRFIYPRLIKIVEKSDAVQNDLFK